MASELFHVSVLSKTATTVVVDVTDTHEKISPPETKTFFFTALYEPGHDMSYPLMEACSEEDMADEDFVEANTPRFIAGVDVIEVKSQDRAVYRVRFTNTKWCKHLRRGQSWGTSSYDIGEPTLRRALGGKPVAEKQSAPRVTAKAGAAPAPPRKSAGKVAKKGTAARASGAAAAKKKSKVAKKSAGKVAKKSAGKVAKKSAAARASGTAAAKKRKVAKKSASAKGGKTAKRSATAKKSKRASAGPARRAARATKPARKRAR